MEILVKALSMAFSLFVLMPNAFTFQTASEQTLFENKGDWETFKRNRSIFGLAAGETPMKKVFAIFGDARLSEPRDPHDLSEVCFKSADGSSFIIFKTGYLHDSDLVYAFAMSKKQPVGQICAASEYIKGYPETADGISLQSTKASVLEILGKPSSEKQNGLQWDYRYYEKYNEPKIGYSEAGPTGARYRIKGTVVGAHHYASIMLRFENNRITDIEVEDLIEADEGFLERLPLDK